LKNEVTGEELTAADIPALCVTLLT
jgi:hypothetical protein